MLTRLLVILVVFLKEPSPAAADPFEQSSDGSRDTTQRSAVVQSPNEPRQPGPRVGTSGYGKYRIDLNGGAVHPSGAMRLWTGFDGRPLFSDTWWGGVNLGVRVSRLVQIDLGVEATGPVVGPKRHSYDERFMRLSFGAWVPRDPNQPLEDPVSDFSVLMMPFGLRFVLPLLGDHVSIGLGGGGSLLLHGEANDRVHPTLGRGCARSCEQRYGLGAYGLARLELIPGAGRRVGIGIVSRYTRARLSGGAYLPAFSGSGDKDEWLQVGGTLSVRF